MRWNLTMKQINELNSIDRPRERIAHGDVESLTTSELIAAVIGKGIKGKTVADISNDIALFMESKGPALSYSELISIKGIGPSRSAQITAALELGKRFYTQKEKAAIRIICPADVLPLVNEIRTKRQEHFVVITLNGAGEVINVRTITVGTLNQSLVHPREVFADAILDRAASVLCVHNHPSGSVTPSTQDIEVTIQLEKAGDILGIRLIDHIIVTSENYVSLKERGDI